MCQKRVAMRREMKTCSQMSQLGRDVLMGGRSRPRAAQFCLGEVCLQIYLANPSEGDKGSFAGLNWSWRNSTSIHRHQHFWRPGTCWLEPWLVWIGFPRRSIMEGGTSLQKSSLWSQAKSWLKISAVTDLIQFHGGRSPQGEPMRLGWQLCRCWSWETVGHLEAPLPTAGRDKRCATCSPDCSYWVSNTVSCLTNCKYSINVTWMNDSITQLLHRKYIIF
jgi:hypothetical protein